MFEKNKTTDRQQGGVALLSPDYRLRQEVTTKYALRALKLMLYGCFFWAMPGIIPTFDSFYNEISKIWGQF